MLRGGTALRPSATRLYKYFIGTGYELPRRTGKSGKLSCLFAVNPVHAPTCGDSEVKGDSEVNKESRFAKDISISPLHSNGQIDWCAAY
jgi:hypothetical protein